MTSWSIVIDWIVLESKTYARWLLRHSYPFEAQLKKTFTLETISFRYFGILYNLKQNFELRNTLRWLIWSKTSWDKEV